MIRWLVHVAGLDNASGPWYLFWSGIAGEVTWVGVPLILYRRYNCHTRRCWRLGKHAVDGTTWVVCRRHHPDVPNLAPLAGDI